MKKETKILILISICVGAYFAFNLQMKSMNKDADDHREKVTYEKAEDGSGNKIGHHKAYSDSGKLIEEYTTINVKKKAL